MRRIYLLFLLVLMTLPVQSNAQQNVSDKSYREAYRDLVFMMAFAKSEGVLLAMTKIGGVPEAKAKKVAELLREHEAKYDVECHMASLQEYSDEIRNAAYLELADGGRYENQISSLTVLWTPFVANGSDNIKLEYSRMHEAAERSKQFCMSEKSKLLKSEFSKLGF